MNIELIETKAEVLADNEKTAGKVRQYLKKTGTYFINLMGSPGAGKTSVLLDWIALLKNDVSIGVIEADVDSVVDAETIVHTGVKTIQVHTGGSCHMDAGMTLKALEKLDCSDLDLVILENVGNLVCPAEFDVGADLKVMLLSVPEGHDKPLKYPLMFTVSDVLLINKIDTKEIFDFDTHLAEQYAREKNPDIPIFEVSALQHTGMQECVEYLKECMHESH